MALTLFGAILKHIGHYGGAQSGFDGTHGKEMLDCSGAQQTRVGCILKTLEFFPHEVTWQIRENNCGYRE
jgi:hypothetical protein